MLQKQFFFTANVVSCLLGLSYASRELDSTRSNQKLPHSQITSSVNKKRLTELLDRATFHQKIYQKRYGHFARHLKDLGFNLSKEDPIEIHILDINESHFTLAGSLRNEPGQASIQEDFLLKANFRIADPSPEYLKVVAMRQLNSFSDDEESAFRGYFRYTNGITEGLALGIKPPVLGITLHAGLNEKELNPEKQFVAQAAHPNLQEETILAQAIYRRQTGRYAMTWNELIKVVSFSYAHHELYDLKNTFPFLLPRQSISQKPLLIEQIL